MFRCIKLNLLSFFVAFALILSSVLFFRERISYVAVSAEAKGIFLPVIMYHSVLLDRSRTGEYVVTPESLESDLKYLSDNGFVSVLPKDLIAYVYDGKELPEKPVMITFDDGFYNNITYALPLLKKYDMYAVISVIGKCIERSEAECDCNPYYSYCTRKQLEELAESGRFEIGNHTFDMHDNTASRKGCMKSKYEELSEYITVFSDDIRALENYLSEETALRPTTFAYPFGFVCHESVPILKSLGYKVTLTCYEKPNYITRDKNTLYGISRYNRSGFYTTEEFMKKLLTE